MRFRRLLEIALGVALLVTTTYMAGACYSLWKLKFPDRPPIHRASPIETARINAVLDILPPAFCKEIGTIIVIDAIEPKVGGLCLPDNRINSIIILIHNQLHRTTIFHEFTHAHVGALSPSAIREWRQIKRGDYLGDKWSGELISSYPKEGFASNYGRDNEDEDIATWGENIYDYLYGESSTLEHGLDKKDPAYREIFDWFLRWGFITDGQHAKLVNDLL